MCQFSGKIVGIRVQDVLKFQRVVLEVLKPRGDEPVYPQKLTVTDVHDETLLQHFGRALFESDDDRPASVKAPDGLAMALDFLITQQRINYELVYDKPFQPTADEIRTMAIALNAEAIEVIDELGWKPWKVPPAINAERVLDELADLTAFYGSLIGMALYKANLTADDLATAYRRKTAVNRERFAGKVPGYGGAKVQADLLEAPTVGAPANVVRHIPAAPSDEPEVGKTYWVEGGFIGKLIGYTHPNDGEKYLFETKEGTTRGFDRRVRVVALANPNGQERRPAQFEARIAQRVSSDD